MLFYTRRCLERCSVSPNPVTTVTKITKDSESPAPISYKWSIVTFSLSRTVFRRNAKAFSLNAIVDVRRRRHKIFWEYLGNYYRWRLQTFDRVALDSLHFDRKRRHKLLPVRRKSYKRVDFGSWSGRDFSIMVQPILKGFTVFGNRIQGLHFLLCNLLDIYAP